jgi:hypothetical protein
MLTGVIAGLSISPGSGTAQAVLLQIRPREGDTLRVRLDQTVEMIGTVRGADGESSTAESSTLVVLTRLAVEDADLETATLLALTDSVRLTAPPNSASRSLLAWATAIEGHRFRFRVATDGSTSLSGTKAWGTPQAGAMIVQMPATLPRRAITPGATWSSSMEVPLTSTSDAKGTATLTATFHFDSLSRSGQFAYLSVRGRLTRSASGSTGGGASVVETSGSMRGSVLVDRRRGWITEARTTISVYSLVVPSAGNKPPMRVRMTISQWMKVL